MMGMPNQTYYDAASLQHMGVHADHTNMQHATRAHPETVSWRGGPLHIYYLPVLLICVKRLLYTRHQDSLPNNNYYIACFASWHVN